MLHHRQSSVNVDPVIFDMAFVGKVMIINSQVVILTLKKKPVFFLSETEKC